jgi:hypothetical protein
MEKTAPEDQNIAGNVNIHAGKQAAVVNYPTSN